MILVVAGACGSESKSANPTTNTIDDHFFDYFKTAVANAEDDGYVPYWLGRNFEAGGYTFRGPHVPGTLDEVSGGGVRFTYEGALPSGAGNKTLDIEEYSKNAWRSVESYYTRPGMSDVSVGDHAARMSVERAADRSTVRSVLVVIPMGDTVIVAFVRAAGGKTSDLPQNHPLKDVPTFLEVMQHLRPYPE